MVAFFSILLAVLLLGITVYGLHRYQTMEVEYTVDRSMPLPPLQDSDDQPPAAAEQAAIAGTPTHAAAPGSQDAPRKPAQTATADQKNTGKTWLQRVAELKKKNRLDEAMAVCRQEFPLWGAYNQACIIERLRLKQAGGKADQEQVFLERLYRLAAIAELLHDKSDDTEPVPLSQLRRLDLARVEGLEFPYQELGYAHLRLIRKSDIKLMLAHWGRPAGHQLPRVLHQDWWQRVL